VKPAELPASVIACMRPADRARYGGMMATKPPQTGKDGATRRFDGTGAMQAPDKPQNAAQGLSFEFPAMSADLVSMPERELQALCEQELSRRGVAFLHLSPRAREKVGWPDLVFALHGTPCAVELKAASGTLSPEQRACLSQMRENGWTVAVIRSMEAFLRFVAWQIETRNEIH
jgi:hypothetical protein